MLLIKSFIIGLAKIIPGVSGAMVAIYLNLYERIITSVTNFFSNWQKNLKFIITFAIGVILAVVLGSKIILYLFQNYKFITMMLFIGTFVGGTINFSKKINYHLKNIFLIAIIVIIFSIYSLIKFNHNYLIKNNFIDNIIFFIGGVVDMFASIIPGISGTSLLMTIGIYNNVLALISHALDIGYIINHINLYLSYLFGMSISFIINAYLVNYYLYHHQNTSYTVIIALSISSIISLLINTFNLYFTYVDFIVGIILFFLGMLLATILDK